MLKVANRYAIEKLTKQELLDFLYIKKEMQGVKSSAKKSELVYKVYNILKEEERVREENLAAEFLTRFRRLGR